MGRLKIRSSLGPKRTSPPAFLWLELSTFQIIGDPCRCFPTATVARIEVGLSASSIVYLFINQFLCNLVYQLILFHPLIMYN